MSVAEPSALWSPSLKWPSGFLFHRRRRQNSACESAASTPNPALGHGGPLIVDLEGNFAAAFLSNTMGADLAEPNPPDRHSQPKGTSSSEYLLATSEAGVNTPGCRPMMRPLPNFKTLNRNGSWDTLRGRSPISPPWKIDFGQP